MKRSILALAAVLAVLFVSFPPTQVDDERLPNIIVILADDLGYGDIQSNYPNGKIATPNIDRLAAAGVRFTDAHSGTALCSPTRYGLLTGQHFSRVEWERSFHSLYSSMIDDERLTLPEMLRDTGYNTAAFGKWHLGQTFYAKDGSAIGPSEWTDWSRPMTGGPLDHGFDRYFGVLFTHAFILQALVSDNLVIEEPTERTDKGSLKSSSYSPVNAMPATLAELLQYLDQHRSQARDKPFFIYYAPIAVHGPLTPAPEFIGRSGIGPYGDFVTQLDSAIGEIMARLTRYGLEEDTLIVVTSDNGSDGRSGVGSLRRFPPGSVYRDFRHKVNGDWRGYKGEVWEGGHRVPFIAHWPRKIPPGREIDHLITLEDLMATIAAIVGATLPPGSAEDSYNILPYLLDTHTGSPIREYAVLSTFQGDPLIRKGDWVLSFHLGSGGQFKKKVEPTDDGPKGLLYNLRTDPTQQQNVWLDEPSRVADLTAFYKEHVERGRSMGINR